MAQKVTMVLDENSISDELQQRLDQISATAADRKDEIVDLLSDEQPSKSRLVDANYDACTWWEGCYYCRDEQNRWHRVKCFA
jgi:hypothetical protein